MGEIRQGIEISAFKNYFEQFRKDVIMELLTTLEKNPEHVSFGPVYLGKSKAGEGVKIISVFDGRDAPGIIQCRYCLIEQDMELTGNVLGYRKMSIEKQPDIIIASGEIRMGVSDQGSAVPIEIANMDILQSEANRLNLPVVWQIVNANLIDLNKVLDTEEKYPGTFTPREAESLRLSQDRWQSLYGQTGFVGAVYNSFTEEYEKKFYPVANKNTGDTPDIIRFNRSDKGIILQPEKVFSSEVERCESNLANLRELIRRFK